MPSFARAYGADCSLCHTMVPALNAYGRYVQSTAFGALDPAIMKKETPIVLRESVNYRSTGKLDSKQPADKLTYLNFSVNAVGVLNRYLSYRLEQSLYSNNLGGGNTGHFWVAYNQLLHGDGHLIAGKFDLPAPPAFSYWQDQSGFSSGSIGVGQHGYNLGGDRWGVGFNYVPVDYEKMPYKAQLSYVGNNPSMINASAFDSSNPYAPGGNGSDKAFQYKVAFARPGNPIEAGIYGDVGSYILASGYVNPIDSYNAAGVYAQRDPLHGVPGVLVFYQRTFDSNIGPGSAAQHLVQSATSKAYAFEFDESLAGGNVMVAVRPVEFIGGLQASKSGLDVLTTAKPHYGVFDIVARDPDFSPYLYLTMESAVAAASNATYGQPAWRIGLKYAGPLFVPAPAVAAVPPIPSPTPTVAPLAAPSTQPSVATVAAATPAATPATSAQAAATPAPQPTENLQAGQRLYAANCAACHGANGNGGVGPNLHRLAAKMSLDRTVAYIKNPTAPMPRLYPRTLSEAQVRQIAAYVRATFR